MPYTTPHPACPCKIANAIKPPCQPVAGVACCVCAPDKALAGGYTMSQVQQYAPCQQNHAALGAVAPRGASIAPINKPVYSLIPNGGQHNARPTPISGCPCTNGGVPVCGYPSFCSCAPKLGGSNAPGAPCKVDHRTVSDPDEASLLSLGFRRGTTQFKEALARRKADRQP